MTHLWRIPLCVAHAAQTPVFTIVAVLSIALGIGANTAIFTLVDQVLLRLLPVKDPARLVMLRGPPATSTTGRTTARHAVVSDVRGFPRSQRGVRRHVRPVPKLAARRRSKFQKGGGVPSARPANWSRAATSRCSVSARPRPAIRASRRSRAGRAFARGAESRLLEQPLLARSFHHRQGHHRQQPPADDRRRGPGRLFRHRRRRNTQISSRWR